MIKVRLGILLWIAFQGFPAFALGVEAIPVTIWEATSTLSTQELEVLGKSEGIHQVEIRPQIEGRLIKKTFTEGASVRAGEILFEIEPAAAKLVLQKAKAALIGNRAKMDLAQKNVQNSKILFEKKMISEQEYDISYSNYKITEAIYLESEVAVQEALLNLSYTTIKAPIAGITQSANYSTGSLVSPNTVKPLTTITQIHPLYVWFSIGEEELSNYKNKQEILQALTTVKLKLSNGNFFPFTGKVNFSASELTEKMGTYQLRATFPNPNAEIVPGQWVKIHLSLGPEQKLFLVPQSAILFSDNTHRVFAINERGEAEMKTLKVGGWREGKWVVFEGLHEKDKVIIDNLMKLKPGMKVKIDTRVP